MNTNSMSILCKKSIYWFIDFLNAQGSVCACPLRFLSMLSTRIIRTFHKFSSFTILTHVWNSWRKYTSVRSRICHPVFNKLEVQHCMNEENINNVALRRLASTFQNTAKQKNYPDVLTNLRVFLSYFLTRNAIPLTYDAFRLCFYFVFSFSQSRIRCTSNNSFRHTLSSHWFFLTSLSINGFLLHHWLLFISKVLLIE